METNQKITINKLAIQRINQLSSSTNGKGVYLGIWKFKEFFKSIKFTHREPITFNIFQDDSSLFNQDKKYPEFNFDYYQRLVNDDRTKKVISFLLKELKLSLDKPSDYLITFPTSLILNLYLSDCESLEKYKIIINDIDVDKNKEFNEEIGVYYENGFVYLPTLNITLVVDGQHRLAGMLAIYESLLLMTSKNDYDFSLNTKLIDYARRSIEKEQFRDLSKIKELIENFQFSCTILLDFDIWEQGKVFADVNFNQKPVNKSLYYDIFGSYPDPERNDLYLAHQWVVYLNNKSDTDSIFYNKIKMLGRGEGFISQAFLVEAFFPLLRQDGVWKDFLNEYINNNIISDKPLIFIEAYFQTIKKLLKDYWPNEGEKPSAYKNILFKTTGLGALISLIQDIYPKIENYVDSEKKQILLEKIESEFYKQDEKNQERVLKINAVELFSQNGNYSKGAGKGLQTRLYKRLAFQMGYRNSPD